MDSKGYSYNKVSGKVTGGGGIDGKGYSNNKTHGTVMSTKRGAAYNTIHGVVTGGGGLDGKGYPANTIHGEVHSCKPMKHNHVAGPDRSSGKRPTKMTGKTNERMY